MRLLPKRLIGQTIRGIRNRLGMSQADFARSVGAESGALVARWEKGQAQPDYGTLAKIATMGVVDVLVFHDTTAAEETPQFTPGEANELREILLRMEALLDDARQLVDRAQNRTALDALEAATGRIPASAGGAEALVLDAELRVETKPRSRTASAGRRSASRTAPSTSGRTRGSSGRSGGGSTGSGGTGSAGSKSSGSRSGSPRAGSSTSGSSGATGSDGGGSSSARGSSSRSRAGSASSGGGGSSRSGGRSGSSPSGSAGSQSSSGGSGSEGGSDGGTSGSTSA
ncbi:MAG TPA: helix-turn-helix transcriptional regulator [Longimicrobium sp.]